jgi:hypothetical protein
VAQKKSEMDKVEARDDVLPPFANEASRVKFEQLQSLQISYGEDEARIVGLTERIKQMEDHSQDVAEELRESQYLV